MSLKLLVKGIRKRFIRPTSFVAPVVSACVALSAAPVVMAQTMITIIASGTLDLNFGTFSGGAAGGTVSVSPAGVRTSTGSVTLIAGAGLESAGVISVSASTGASVVVSMDAPNFPVDDAGAGAIMQVDNFDINGGGATTTELMTTNPIELPIGGRLNVGAAQLGGVYTGSYTVNVNYL